MAMVAPELYNGTLPLDQRRYENWEYGYPPDWVLSDSQRTVSPELVNRALERLAVHRRVEEIRHDFVHGNAMRPENV
jgi:hypothetical protein